MHCIHVCNYQRINNKRVFVYGFYIQIQFFVEMSCLISLADLRNSHIISTNTLREYICKCLFISKVVFDCQVRARILSPQRTQR